MGIVPCRCASVQSSVPAVEEELCSLHGGFDSSECWLWVCISVAFCGEITSPMQKAQLWTLFFVYADGRVRSSKYPYSWREQRLVSLP